MLLTKLNIPTQNKNSVKRSKLFKKLDVGLEHKLTLISAPAGFGKTTLISGWINLNKIPTAWFSIDKNNNDIVGFLNYVIYALQRVNLQCGQSALNLLKSSNLTNPESIVNLLINDIINIDKNFLLVFDDFHLIENNDIINLVSYFLEYIPQNIHIIISTRSDPNLPIARLRSQNHLVELRSSDLSLSKYDISVLFNKKFKIKLSENDICILKEKTEGWAAGLQLTALSIQDNENISKFIKNLKGDNRYIMDYLIEELLKNQSDYVKDFLLQTSILEQMSAPLCNQVLNRTDSQLILEKLEKNGMFIIPLDTDRHWYRYHHLFNDLLKQRLSLKDKTLIEDLHKKAINWFEDNNMYNFAIDHALIIKYYSKTIQLLGEVVETMWENGRHSAIENYGNLLPDDLLFKNPKFCLYYSWILIFSGDIIKAKPYLSAAEKSVKQQINDKKSIENKKLLGKIAVAFAYLNSHDEHSQKIFNYCSIAMENLSEEDPMWYSWAWFSYGIAYFSEGNLLESKKAFDKAFKYGKETGNIYLISTIVIRMAENEQQLGNYNSAYQKCSELLSLINDKGYSHLTEAEWTYAPLYLILGSTYLGWAEMDKALENIKIAYNLSKKGNDYFLKIYVLIIYSTILRYLGKIENEKIINELEDLIKHNTIPLFIKSLYIAWKIHILTEQNKLNKANEIIQDNDLALEKEKNNINDGAYAAYARLLIKEFKLEEAESLLLELYSLASSNNRFDMLIELNISFIHLYRLKGENNKSVNCLLEALEMASYEEQFFIFVFWSDSIADELKQVYKLYEAKKTNIPQSFINKLRIAIKNKDKSNKNLSDNELSARELDTLRLIAQNLTNQEIADKLFISLNTAKTHVRNILLKLDAANRIKAVAIAKELKII